MVVPGNTRPLEFGFGLWSTRFSFFEITDHDKLSFISYFGHKHNCVLGCGAHSEAIRGSNARKRGHAE